MYPTASDFLTGKIPPLGFTMTYCHLAMQIHGYFDCGVTQICYNCSANISTLIVMAGNGWQLYDKMKLIMHETYLRLRAELMSNDESQHTKIVRGNIAGMSCEFEHLLRVEFLPLEL